MEDFLYPYNQPVVKAKYDLIIDGKIVADEVVTKNGSVGGLTTEQVNLLTAYASAEGRNIPISEDGEIITQVGHTYTITAKELPVKCTDADSNPLCEVAAHKQIAFVATGTAAYVDNVTCTVTEVFKAAAPVELSGNGGGEPEGDYVTLDANGCITSGRLDTLVDGSYLQHGKKLTTWDIALPSLSNGVKMFSRSTFDKVSVLKILNELPTHSDGLHLLTLGIHADYQQDNEILDAIASVEGKGWLIQARFNGVDLLPRDFTPVEYLHFASTNLNLSPYIKIPEKFTTRHGVKAKCSSDNFMHGNTLFGIRSVAANLKGLYLTCPHLVDADKIEFCWDEGDFWEEMPYTNSNIPLSFEMNFENSGTLVINEKLMTKLNNISGDPYISEYNIGKFTLEALGFYNPFSFIGRLFYLDISEGDDVIHSFVPAVDETGAPCLYDIIEQKAYYNSGTDDFMYPNEDTTYSLRRVLPDWGKLTERGLKRLYHVPDGYTGELIDYALENGYKRIVEPEMPEDGYWTPKWRETEEEIILDWIETEALEMEEV